MSYSRKELIDLCVDSIVSHENWSNRDSASAQKQIGELLVLLVAECPFEVVTKGHWSTTDKTIVVKVSYKGFSWFEDGDLSEDSFYLPTRDRLNENPISDWY